MRRVFVSLVSALALAGCSPSGQGPLLTPTLVDAQRAATSATATQRVETGLVARYGGIYQHAAAQGLVEATLADLIRVADGQHDLPGTIILLNSSSYNAFSLPNGQLFVTRGMLALANDQAELAAALAHELGHVIARHAAQRIIERARATADTVEVARTFGDDDVTRATIQSHQLSLAAFSRNQEFEADKISLELLAKAGYDSAGALRILQSLDRMRTLGLRQAGVQQRPDSPGASHPPNPARIAAVRNALKARTASGGKVEREKYLAAISGVAYGEDGRGGYIRGRAYLDPKLDVALTLPQGYLLFGGGSSLGAIKQGGKTIAIISRGAPGLASDPEGALRRMLANVQTEVKISPLPAGGPEGAIGSFEKDRTATRIAIVKAGEAAWRLLFIAKPADPAIDRDIAQTLASLRALNAKDRALARPLALRISRGDGLAVVRRFAASTGDADSGAQTILALNGLSGTGEVRSGTTLKVPEFIAP